MVTVFHSSLHITFTSFSSVRVLMRFSCLLLCAPESHMGLSDISVQLSIMLSRPPSWSPLFCDDSPWKMWDFRFRHLVREFTIYLFCTIFITCFSGAGTLGWMPWTYRTYPNLVSSPPVLATQYLRSNLAVDFFSRIKITVIIQCFCRLLFKEPSLVLGGPEPEQAEL